MPDGLRSPCAEKTNAALAGGRVLVTGAAGMLGSQLLLDAPGSCQAVWTDLGPAPDGNPEVELIGVDLTDEAAVMDLFARERFTGVIHAAAYTAVDKAETEPERAFAINRDGAAAAARAAERSNGMPWKSGWPLYQATNSVAGQEPGRSSPGMPMRRSACAPNE